MLGEIDLYGQSGRALNRRSIWVDVPQNGLPLMKATSGFLTVSVSEPKVHLFNNNAEIMRPHKLRQVAGKPLADQIVVERRRGLHQKRSFIELIADALLFREPLQSANVSRVVVLINRAPGKCLSKSQCSMKTL